MNTTSRMSRAFQTSLKAGLVGILVLVFLIPVGMIREVRSERESYRQSAVEDVSAKAGGRTLLITPYLAVPVQYEVWDRNDKGEAYRSVRSMTIAVFPESLTLTADTRVEPRSRGIYTVPVHRTDAALELQFAFRAEDVKIPEVRVLWPEISLQYVYEDSRSLRESPILTTPDGVRKTLRSGTPALELAARSVSAPVPISPDPSGDGRVSARLDLALSGAEALDFLALGDTNTLKLSCDWASPSFSGYRLPAGRDLGESGFRAEWFVDEPARVLPRVLAAPDFRTESIAGAAFGVDFLQPTDVYQQVHRALRYAVLFLFIPFAALFLFEVLARRRLHVVQYILVGLANCLFYLLLLALAEHLPFLAAYLVSAAAVCSVTTFYVGAFLPDKRQAALAFGILAVQYGYLFCALSSEDYALLIGSVGLFDVVALTMAATRNVDWFGGKGDGAPDPEGEPQELPDLPGSGEPGPQIPPGPDAVDSAEWPHP